jgi:hypothetical protein
VTLTDANGASLAPSDKVGSGASLVSGDDRASVVVPGDVNKDAKINVRDVIGAMRVLVGNDEGYFTLSVDVDKSGTASGEDVVKLMKYLVGWNEQLGAKREKATNDDASLEMYFTSTMFRVPRSDTTVYGDPDGIVRMAKNEIEDAHIMLTSTGSKEGLTLDVGEIKNSAGDVLDREVRYGYYYEISLFTEELLESREKQDWGLLYGDAFTDPYPILNAPFSIGANESKSFLVKIKTGANSAPGWYAAPVRVLDAQGNEVKRATLRVYVWDFALDETPACKTLFGMDSGGLAWNVQIYDGAIWTPKYANDWYGYVLENKISSYGLPSGEYTDKAMDDPRVTAFVSAEGSVGVSSFDKPEWVARLKDTYAHLSTKEEWLEKAYIYDVDEPSNSDGALLVKKQWEGSKEALGDIPFKTILPITGNNWMADLGCDMFEYCLEYCNAICPQSNCFTISAPTRERKQNKDVFPAWGEYMADAQLAKYGQFRPRYDALRERGDDMWWYICIGPMAPYANWWIAQQGAVNRAVLWQQHFYDIDGILYWAMTAWQMGEHDSRKINLKRVNNGDGLLLYNGDLWEEGVVPVPSIRFEAVRDGIEDFQYLRQLERQLGRDAALAYTTRVTTDILVYSQDYHDIESAREEMGFELEALAALSD